MLKRVRKRILRVRKRLKRALDQVANNWTTY